MSQRATTALKILPCVSSGHGCANSAVFVTHSAHSDAHKIVGNRQFTRAGDVSAKEGYLRAINELAHLNRG